jgi:glycosidase
VASQQADPKSLYNFTKTILNLRKETPALYRGEFVPLRTPAGTLAYLRQSEEQTVLVAMNFSKRFVSYTPPEGLWRNIISTSEGAPGRLATHEIQILIRE